MFKCKILVSGLKKEQMEKGIPALLDEFTHRPWLLDTDAYFDESNNLLVVVVGYDIDTSYEDGALDEISDCVLATMQFDEMISFDIAKI